MFRNATGFSLIAGEVTNVEGTLRRQNSPNETNFVNGNTPSSFSTFGTGNPYGHPPQAPVQPATHHQSGRGIGMFANASNFMMTTGRMTNTEGDYEQINSGTRTTINIGEAAAAHAQHHAARYEATGAGLYNDSRSSAYYGQPQGPNYAHPPTPPMYAGGNNSYGSPQMVYGNGHRPSHTNAPRNNGGHPMAPPVHPAPHPPSGGVSRRHSDLPYATNAAPVDNRGSRRPARAQTVYPQTQAVQPQTTGMQPRESKHKKKTKGKDGRTRKHRHEAEEVSSEDELAFTPIKRSTTF